MCWGHGSAVSPTKNVPILFRDRFRILNRNEDQTFPSLRWDTLARMRVKKLVLIVMWILSVRHRSRTILNVSSAHGFASFPFSVWELGRVKETLRKKYPTNLPTRSPTPFPTGVWRFYPGIPDIL